jgi:hypothetical protein
MMVPGDAWRRRPCSGASVNHEIDVFAALLLRQLRNARRHRPRCCLIPRRFNTENTKNHGEPRRIISILGDDVSNQTARKPEWEHQSLLRGAPWFSVSSVLKTLRTINEFGVGDFPRGLSRHSGRHIAIPFNV